MLKYSLPDLYHKLLPAELLQFQINETKATCDQCNWKAYKPDLKCCTFEPYLPNYLVGAIFESNSTSAAARNEMQNKIAKRTGSLPIGMTAPISYQVEFNKRKPKDFGNREDWLCPYFNRELQNCGIWKYRGAVCTTYYCQSNFGKKGLEFWEQLNDYLTYVEMALMEEILVHLDFSPRQISDCLVYLNRKEATKAEMSTTSIDLATSKKLWNGYFNEQEEFFRKTFHMAKDFDRKRFQEALGEIGHEIQEKLLEKVIKLS
jgi:hypothetical protein